MKNKHTCNINILNSFSSRINHLAGTVSSRSPSGIKLIGTLKTLMVIKSLSRIVIRNFSQEWQKAACDIHADKNCTKVLDQAVTIKDQLIATHIKLCTLPSPFAQWAGRRLVGPVLDWNDLVLDLSIASDPEIQNSLSELEELL